jgi:predicted anti-sigma-YlaC factor YlaD
VDAILLLPGDRPRVDDLSLVRALACARQARGVCPDANHLAAWAERRCAGLARRRIERHLATCEDCRDAVAAAVVAA